MLCRREMSNNPTFRMSCYLSFLVFCLCWDLGFVWSSAMFRLSLVLVLLGPSMLLAAEPKPNIVMIIGDDQAWTDYGFMGHKVVRTPNLDKLAAESLVFPQGYVPS